MKTRHLYASAVGLSVAFCFARSAHAAWDPVTFSKDVEFPVALSVHDDGSIQIAGFISQWSPFNEVTATYDASGTLVSNLTGGAFVSPYQGATDFPINGVAIQPDGKVLLAGFMYSTKWDFAVARYDTEGILDSSFGVGGVATVSLGTIDDEAEAITIQPDGKILLAGYQQTDATHLSCAFVRLNRDGTLDTDFGTGGVTSIALATRVCQITGMTLDPTTGKIVGAGMSSKNGYVTIGTTVVLRLNSDGTPDSSFNTVGVVVSNDLRGSRDRSHAVVVQADGKIVVSSTNALNSMAFAIRRFNADGSVDTGFGSGGDGVVTTDFGTDNEAVFSLISGADGKLVAGGWSHTGNTNYDFALARYNNDGTLDGSFGNGGTVVTDLGTDDDEIFSLAMQCDGSILAAGFTHVGNARYGLAIAHYGTDGSLNPTPTPPSCSPSEIEAPCQRGRDEDRRGEGEERRARVGERARRGKGAASALESGADGERERDLGCAK